MRRNCTSILPNLYSVYSFKLQIFEFQIAIHFRSLLLFFLYLKYTYHIKSMLVRQLKFPIQACPTERISFRVRRSNDKPLILQVHFINLWDIFPLPLWPEPNDESSANVDAAKMWRDDRDQFNRIAERLVRKTLNLPYP